jgi:hypothetical protein
LIAARIARAVHAGANKECDVSVALWIGTLALIPILGYSLQFTEATLLLGRSLSDSGSRTGFQNAITPPWEAKLSLVIYGLGLILVGLSWYEFGIGRAFLCVIALFVGLLIGRQLLPKPDSPHFKTIIVRSMSNRYADYVRAGDRIRGDLMKMLLQKAGVSVGADQTEPSVGAEKGVPTRLEYSFVLQSGRRVKLSSFHFSHVYEGLMAGLPKNEPGYVLEQKTKAEKMWGSRPVYTIPPATVIRVYSAKKYESWPSYCYKAWFKSAELDSQNAGSELVVIWFGESPSDLGFLAMVEQACREVNWEQHAKDWNF